MKVRRWFTLALALATATALLGGSAVRAAGTTPAIAAFNAMFANVNDYTYTFHSHENKGSQSQDRVYSYDFLRPSYVKTLILDGDGKGGGGVWTGGDQVSGHQGGLLSAIHLKVDLHDPRAVSLLGYTIPDGLIQNIINKYATVPGTLTQGNGGVLGGVETDRLDNKVADPAANNGITEMILYLNHDTHWPIRQILYAGTTIAVDQDFSDIKTNTGLKPSDFPF
jgi:outer membrane lipoprotein-sorting protein